MLCLAAYAKINWTLDILGTRPDGYHLMDMLMQTVSLCDLLWMEEAEDLTLEAVPGGPGSRIKGEFAQNGVPNPLKHTYGVLSMARSMMKDSAGSQFFIMTSDSPHLDGAYAAFGKVTSGMEVADGIVSQRTDRADKPLEPQVIASIRVETNGIAYPFTKL